MALRARDEANLEAQATAKQSAARTNATIPSSPPNAASPLAADASTDDPVPVADTTIADTPLPPHDTPLAQILEQLESRARRGDRKAACRLAMDGHYCRSHPLDRDSVAFFERAIARRERTTAADVAWISRLEAAHQRAVRLCSGLPERWVKDHAWRYLLQAAQGGDDFLAAMYAIAPAFEVDDFLERPEPWTYYREHAAPLLLRAAEAGELRAIWRLQRIHAGNGALTGMPNAIERNPRTAAVYAVALRQATSGDSLREFETYAREAEVEYGPEAWRDIDAEGRALAQRHFAGLPPEDLQRGVFGEIDSRRCQD